MIASPHPSSFPIPFDVTLWSEVHATEHLGETGTSWWKTIQYGDLRIRVVEYSKNYKADHWCQKGHIVYCLEGEFTSEEEGGKSVVLKKGMSYQVSDNLSSHRSSTHEGATLFIVDGAFLAAEKKTDSNPLPDFQTTFDSFTLRPIGLADALAYFALVDENRKRISTFFPGTANSNKSAAESVAFVNQKVESAHHRKAMLFVILDNATGKMIGSVSLKDIDWNTPKCELGFFIDAAYEGKGIISKALFFLVKYCFEYLKLNKVFMRIAGSNAPSRKVAEKCQFQEEGILKRDFKTHEGRLIDVIYYGRLNPYPVL